MSPAPTGSPWIRDAWAYEARRRLRDLRRGRLQVGPGTSVAMTEEVTETRTAPVWGGWKEET